MVITKTVNYVTLYDNYVTMLAAVRVKFMYQILPTQITITMKNLQSILLVENDEDDQFFFKEALRTIKNTNLYNIANNGKEALTILKSAITLPDIIFMDINMPVMDGLQCLEEIVKTPELKNIPVVMLSDSLAEKKTAQLRGAKAFIHKPMDGQELHDQIEEMVNLDFISDSAKAAQTFSDRYSPPSRFTFLR